MIPESQIISELSASSETIVSKTANLSYADFNYRESAGIWSVGDVIEHLVNIESTIAAIVKGHTEDTDRDPEEKILIIKNTFEDRNRKLKAGKEIAPSDTLKEPQKIVSKFLAVRKILTGLIGTAELYKICKVYGHGIFGELTGIEWIYFVIYHSNRHALQIKRIISTLE